MHHVPLESHSVDRDVVKNLCLLQVFDWEVKATEPAETVRLFTDFCTVRYRYLLCISSATRMSSGINNSVVRTLGPCRPLRPMIRLDFFRSLAASGGVQPRQSCVYIYSQLVQSSRKKDRERVCVHSHNRRINEHLHYSERAVVDFVLATHIATVSCSISFQEFSHRRI